MLQGVKLISVRVRKETSLCAVPLEPQELGTALDRLLESLWSGEEWDTWLDF